MSLTVSANEANTNRSSVRALTSDRLPPDQHRCGTLQCLHKNRGECSIRGWVLSCDELPIQDHIELEDALVRDLNVPTGDPKGIVHVKGNLTTAHICLLNPMLLVIREHGHPITGVRPTLRKLPCCVLITSGQCGAEFLGSGQGCRDRDRAVAQQHGRFPLGMEVS